MDIFLDKDWNSLLTKTKNKSFNLFHTIEDLIVENSISKMLTFFLEPSNNHGLGQSFSLAIVNFLISKKLLTIPQAILSSINKNEIQVTATFNYCAGKRGYIDILLVGEDMDDKPAFIVAFESKIDAPERKKQIEDYQNYISHKFKNCPSVIVFLTPRGKDSITANNTSKCSCVPLSFAKISEIISKLPSATSDGATFLKMFGEYMKNGFSNSLDQQTQKEIKECWSKHAEDLKVIYNYGCRIENARFFITERIMDYLNTNNLENIAYIRWVYPRKKAIPHEYNLILNNINKYVAKQKLSFEILYMLYNPSKKPEESHSWELKLMIWYNNPREKKQAENLKKKYAAIARQNPSKDSQWGGWICLDEEQNIDLGKYSTKDAEKVSRTIRDFEKKTYTYLRKALKNS